MLTENCIVHGLWIGPLSRLERLTLHTFVEHGHEFHLWRYEPTAPELIPPGVVVRDAAEVLPRESVFRKREDDPRQGLGAGSYATFSDLFRVKLLHDIGGIWVDMDVICLRPFDFDTPYVFRAHALGAVMNVIKAPPASPLMAELLQRMTARTCDNSGWFDFTLAFIEGIGRHGLETFVRNDLMPEDRWESLKPFLESDAEFNPAWYGLHWMNELWRKLRATGGAYLGQKLVGRLPDRNHPIPGTRLHQLYERHGLLPRGRAPSTPPRIPMREPAPRQAPTAPRPWPPSFDVVIASLNLGGAERIVQELMQGLQDSGTQSRLFVLHDVQPAFTLDGVRGCEVVRLHELPWAERLPAVAAAVSSSPSPLVFAHLVRVRDLEALGSRGVRTVPVIHNQEPGWLDRPDAFDRPWIPFVVAVSEAVEAQLSVSGCRKPIIVLRHELQRPIPSPQLAERERQAIRRRHGVHDDTLLIGMVGQFKAQKAYTRAVRVLHRVRQQAPARLMILGGWSQVSGSGRATYTAMCAQALELGVIADVLAPGPVQPAEPYYSAFDVFLNTSLHEGLSLAMLEASARGCPIVSTNVGGAAEVLDECDVALPDPFDVEACAQAVLELARRPERRLKGRPAEPDLVPKLWTLFSRHGSPAANLTRRPSATLVVTENLNIGGPQRSLTNLLCHLPRGVPAIVATLEPAHGTDFLDQLSATGVRVIATPGSLMERSAALLELIEQENVQTLVFWNAPAALKLVLAKVLEVRPIRLVDVSPGPMLRREMLAAHDFGRRLSMSPQRYFARLNVFVAKHADGVPPELSSAAPDRVRIIPNGVTLRPQTVSRGAPVMSIGACCRIVPEKRLDLLVDVMDVMLERLPELTLTIIGAADPWHEEYAAHIADKISRAGLSSNIHFVDPGATIWPYLESLRALVMLSDDQGCPNASLEAMAAGVPVVANRSGGVAEQVVDGVTGLLVPDDDPVAIANAIASIVVEPALRERLGAAARRHVTRHFSMQQMVDGYLEVFAPAQHHALATCQ